MTRNRPAPSEPVSFENKSIRLYVTIQGVLVGLGGMIHGIAETLQGSRPTEGLWLVSIGAFSLIPNYLATGIVAILVGACLLVWTIGAIHTQHGPTVFLILSITLFMVGGGVAQIVFFLIAWGVSTQIHQPLTWWRKTLPESFRKQLAKGWWLNFAAGYLFLSVGIFIWLILTPPGAEYKDPVMQYICWASLLVGLVFQFLTIVSGFARDIQKQVEGVS
jgi:hypothetical protein